MGFYRVRSRLSVTIQFKISNQLCQSKNLRDKNRKNNLIKPSCLLKGINPSFSISQKVSQIKNTHIQLCSNLEKQKPEIYIEQILKAFLRESKLTKSKALMKKFASCFFVATCYKTTVLFSTNSLMK